MVIPRIFAPLALAVAAGGISAPLLMDAGPAPPATDVVAEPCIDGIMPGNPYARNCNLPQQQRPRVRGQAPDPAAIIACRNIPGCLAYYVNYPGATIWDPPVPRARG